MSEAGNASVTMAVDTKKYGIRIHKALFRQLGEPRYIFSGLEDSTAPDEEWTGDSETEEDSVC